MADINRAIHLQPDFVALYVTRGDVLGRSGDHSRAIAEYNKAINLNPSDAYAYNDRAVVYQEMGKIDKALADYHQAIMLAPDYAEVYYHRSFIYLDRGDYSRAIADLSEYVQLAPRDGTGYATRASAFSAQRDYQRAQADLREATELAPQDSQALNNQAWFRATCPENSFRDGSAAVSEARRACELTKWKNQSFIDTLAAAYAEVGDFDQAMSYEEQAMKGLSGQWRKEGEAHLALYREHKPYRETPASKAASPTPTP